VNGRPCVREFRTRKAQIAFLFATNHDDGADDFQKTRAFYFGITFAQQKRKYFEKGEAMKSKKLMPMTLLAAAAIVWNAAPTWGQSVGGSQSERSGESQTPVSKGNQTTGSDAPSKAQKSGTGQSGKDSSVGGTQSKRTPDSDTPVPEGRFSDPSKAGKSQSPRGAGQSNKDTSIGGTQDRRSGESDTPLPQGNRSAGSDDPSKAGRGSRHTSQVSGIGGQQDIRQAQEALKNQGHDPGPIDGVMGPQTRQALRTFQSSNGLKQTGMLDAETKQKLNIEDSATRGSTRGTR
jgi:Putative peptidoglycan binding domain